MKSLRLNLLVFLGCLLPVLGQEPTLLTTDTGATINGSNVSAYEAAWKAALNLEAGTVTWHSSYVYVCISANTCKRAALLTW